MLRRCEVREIILNGGQSDEEQKNIISWHHKQLEKDQEQMPGNLDYQLESKFQLNLFLFPVSLLGLVLWFIFYIVAYT